MGVLESIGNQFCLDMLELSSDRICILDCEGRVHFANKAFRDKFVFEEDQDAHFPLNGVFRVEDFSRFTQMLLKAKKSEGSLQFIGIGKEEAPVIVTVKRVPSSDLKEDLFYCLFRPEERYQAPMAKINQLLSLYDFQEDTTMTISTEHKAISVIGEMAGANAAYWCPYDKKKEKFGFMPWRGDIPFGKEEEIFWFTMPLRGEKGQEESMNHYDYFPHISEDFLLELIPMEIRKELTDGVDLHCMIVGEGEEPFGAVLISQKEFQTQEQILWNLFLSQLKSYVKTKREYYFFREQFYKYKFGINAIGVATWEWDIRSNSIIFSRKWAEIMGFRYEELSERIEDWKNRWHPEEREENERLLEAYLSGEIQSYSPIYRMQHRDGHWKWLMTRGHLVRDRLGNPVTISGFHVDITESETMRAHFLQEKEKYLDIIEATRAGTWEWNIQTGENIYNERWAEIVGYTLKELEPITDDTWASLVHPDDLVRSDEIVQSLFYREKEYYSMECRMRHKDGHWVWVLDKGKVVRWTEDGKPLQMFGTHIDITEAKLLEMEVKQREDNYRLLVESSYDIVYRLDKDGILLFISAAWEKVLGHSIKEALGQSFEPYVHKDDLHRIQKFFRHIEHTGKRMETADYRLLHKDGSYHWFTTNAVPILDEAGIVIGFTGIARDTTEVKKANLKILEQKDELERFFRVNLDFFCITDSRGIFLKVNDAWEKFLGFKVKHIRGQNALQFVHPEDLDLLKESISQMIEDKKEGSFTLRFRRADESYVMLEWKAQYIDNLIYAAARDVTEKKKLQENLYIEKELFRTTLLSVGDGVIATDETNKVLLMNTAAQEMTGWRMEEALGRPIDEIYKVIYEDYDAAESGFSDSRIYYRSGESSDRILLAKDGRKLPVEENISPIKGSDQGITGIVTVFRDITPKIEKQKQTEYLSYHDVLTGLYNRRFAEDMLKRIDLNRNLPLSVMVMDLNGLKLTNDAFGHDLGDLLLMKSADIMKSHLREGDVLSRMGGDEFMVLMPKTSLKEAEDVKTKILKEADACEVGPVQISLAIGIATKTLKHQNIQEVVKVSDNNMYREKLKYGKIMKNKMIETILASIGEKFPKEKEHLHHVAMIAKSIGEAMGMSKEAQERLFTAGKLHDIGKINVPKEILLKAGPLSYEEYEVVKKHAETSYQIIKSVEDYGYLAEDVLYHHERFDGKGYPEGLKGQEIPLHSRILNIADAFEAMTHERTYSRKRSLKEAAEELRAHAGTQFDPQIVEIFLGQVLKIEKH